MGAFVEFNKAVFAALNGNAALTTIIGASKVFDDVPVQGEATAPLFPYVVIGDQQGTEDGTASTSAAQMQVTIDAWSRGAGKQQVLQMLDAIRDALDAGPENKSHATATGALVYLNYLAHETQPGGDRETWHGIIRFRGLYEYG